MKQSETGNSNSKSQFGTFTAAKDANNDYSSSTATSSTSGMASKTAKKTSSNASHGTLTAKADANGDYQ